MATAQNLAQFQGESDVDLARWREATGWPDHALDRMQRWRPDHWRAVPIQPWMDGIMPALAGIWMLANSGDAPASLDEIASQVSVTNFFKHSLRQEGSARLRDLNPRDLETGLKGPYVALTRDRFVEPEVTQLAPAVIIAFSSLGKLNAFRGMNVPVVLANDPSWIKQGMSGVAREGGSWRTRVEGASIPRKVRSRVDGWLGQLSPPYSTGKRDSARIYLLHTFLALADGGVEHHHDQVAPHKRGATSRRATRSRADAGSMNRRTRRVFDQLVEPDRVWSWEDLQREDASPPAKAGVYAWYFKRKPPGVPGDGCRRFRRMPLLYVGVSPGRLGSQETLRSRLRYHFTGNASGSTLRTTLGALLQRELGLSFRRVRSERTMRFLPADEQRLSEWMFLNARVTWSVCERPWEVERELLHELSAPLNLAGNTHNPFHLALSSVRRVMVENARRTPIWN